MRWLQAVTPEQLLADDRTRGESASGDTGSGGDLPGVDRMARYANRGSWAESSIIDRFLPLPRPLPDFLQHEQILSCGAEVRCSTQ